MKNIIAHIFWGLVIGLFFANIFLWTDVFVGAPYEHDYYSDRAYKNRFSLDNRILREAKTVKYDGCDYIMIYFDRSASVTHKETALILFISREAFNQHPFDWWPTV